MGQEDTLSGTKVLVQATNKRLGRLQDLKNTNK